MKHILIALFILVGISANAQKFTNGFMEDTLTNAETAYLYPNDAATALTAPTFKGYGALQVTMVFDSLSGATAGTALLEGCYDDACTYTYTITSVTINGATQQVSTTEDAFFMPPKWRIKNTVTGTQSTRCRVYYAWKEINK